MKLLIIVMSLLMLTSCASKTEFGKCVGISQDKDPTLKYEISVRNIIVGAVFFELIAPPVMVIFRQLECPVGKKDVP